jgi:RIO-like serine/threonine protein kinase
MKDGMTTLKANELRALTQIKKLTDVEDRMSVAMLVKETGLTKKQAQRAMDRVSKWPGVGKRKLQADSNGGHQPVGYWWKGV